MANLNNNKIKFDNAFIVVENAGEKTDSNGNVDQYAFDGENEDEANSQKKTVRFLKKYEGKYISPTVTFGNEDLSESKQQDLQKKSLLSKQGNNNINKMPAKADSFYSYPYVDIKFYCNDLISYVYNTDGTIKRYNITKAANLIQALKDYNKSVGADK